jgi:hypothetical protein
MCCQVRGALDRSLCAQAQPYVCSIACNSHGARREAMVARATWDMRLMWHALDCEYVCSIACNSHGARREAMVARATWDMRLMWHALDCES